MDLHIPSGLAVPCSRDLGGLKRVFDHVSPVNAPQEPTPCRGCAGALCLHSSTLRGFLRDDSTLTLNFRTWLKEARDL
jgi:hypothetical protein